MSWRLGKSQALFLQLSKGKAWINTITKGEGGADQRKREKGEGKESRESKSKIEKNEKAN